MFATKTQVITFIIVLALLQLVLSEPPSSTPTFVQLCIPISPIHCFTSLLAGMIYPAFIHFASILPSELLVPFLLSWIKIQHLDAFDSIATIISFASTVSKPLHSVTAILLWTLRQCTVPFGTSIHIALLVRFAPEPSKCHDCSSRCSEFDESSTVAKVEDTRSRDPAFASRPLDDSWDSDRSRSSATDTLVCTDEADVALSSSQDIAESSFGDPDNSPNSTWDDSDTTSATLLSDSDICSIAARFNHALVKERFCVEYSIFRTPESGCNYPLATEASTGDVDSVDTNVSDSSCTSGDTFLRLGDLLSASFSSTSIPAQSPAPCRRTFVASPSCSSFDLSPLPTHASHGLDSVFSTSFAAVATASTGSRSAPVFRRSSFSFNAPFFRPLGLFASSTSSDVSLAATSPSPSRPLSTYGPLMLLPARNLPYAPPNSSLSDVYFDAPEAAADPPFPFPQSTTNARFLRLACSLTDAPKPAPLLPASLSAWYLAEGKPVSDDSAPHPLRIFGIPVEDLPASSSSVSSSSGDFSSKDEAYLCAALGLHEAASVPRRGFCAASGDPRRWHPSRGEWCGWVFPGRGDRTPTFVPEEIPAQTPYNEDELGHLRARWGFSPTTI